MVAVVKAVAERAVEDWAVEVREEEVRVAAELVAAVRRAVRAEPPRDLPGTHNSHTTSLMHSRQPHVRGRRSQRGGIPYHTSGWVWLCEHRRAAAWVGGWVCYCAEEARAVVEQVVRWGRQRWR